MCMYVEAYHRSQNYVLKRFKARGAHYKSNSAYRHYLEYEKHLDDTFLLTKESKSRQLTYLDIDYNLPYIYFPVQFKKAGEPGSIDMQERYVWIKKQIGQIRAVPELSHVNTDVKGKDTEIWGIRYYFEIESEMFEFENLFVTANNINEK